MSFNFSPLTEEELNAVNLVEDGIYNFEVIRSAREVSKAGNDMAKLHIKFWDKEGHIHTLFDYLVFSSVNLNIRKVKHFCDATGLSAEYSKGEVPEELGGYSGKFNVGTQDAQGPYAAKNVVVDYIVGESVAIKDAVRPPKSSRSTNEPVNNFKDDELDDLPF